MGYMHSDNLCSIFTIKKKSPTDILPEIILNFIFDPQAKCCLLLIAAR